MNQSAITASDTFHPAVDPRDESVLVTLKKILTGLFIWGGLIALLGFIALMQSVSWDFSALWEQVMGMAEHSGKIRVRNLLDRLAKQGLWSYFTDPYFLATTGLTFLGFAVDVAGHAYKRKSWREGWRSSAFYRVFVRRSESGRTDLLLFIYNRLSLYFVVVPLFGLLGPLFMYLLLLEVLDFNLLGGMENAFLKFIIFMVAADFAIYVAHFLLHKNKALWEIHKFHHGCTEMNIITGTRDHPFEKAIHKVFIAVPLAVLGAPTEQFFAVMILQYTLSVLLHSDWDISYGFLDKILVSPRMHRLHHSARPEHWDVNYGVIFSFWDALFGTLYRGKNYDAIIDVTDNYFNRKGFIYDLLMPMIKFCKQVRKSPFEWVPDGRTPEQKSPTA